MTEIKIKDWDKHYKAPTRKHMYGIIWWANKRNRLNFAHKKDDKWVINLEAFEAYYEKHGQMGIERVKEPEETADPYKQQVIALLHGLFESVKQAKAKQETLANQHQAYKAVVEGQGRKISDLEDNMSLRNKINISLLIAMVLSIVVNCVVLAVKFWG